MDQILFILSSILCILGAIGVVFIKNIMQACIALLFSLLGVAGLYLTLGADFVAATQLVVYVGGVVILMVFAVMLTGGPSSQKVNKFGIIKVPMMGNLKSYLLGLGSIIVLFMILGRILGRMFNWSNPNELPPFTETVEKIGTLLVTDHVLAFEISSILLLGALIGAAMIARPRKEF